MKGFRNTIIFPIAVFLLICSGMTFCVAKEVYDPHVGVALDIFCKSLYVVGENICTPEDIFLVVFAIHAVPVARLDGSIEYVATLFPARSPPAEF